MPRKPKKVPERIDPNKIKSRNLLMVKLLTGSTKAGVQLDQKKEGNRRACRRPVEESP